MRTYEEYLGTYSREDLWIKVMRWDPKKERFFGYTSWLSSDSNSLAVVQAWGRNPQITHIPPSALEVLLYA